MLYEMIWLNLQKFLEIKSISHLGEEERKNYVGFHIPKVLLISRGYFIKHKTLIAIWDWEGRYNVFR